MKIQFQISADGVPAYKCSRLIEYVGNFSRHLSMHLDAIDPKTRTARWLVYRNTGQYIGVIEWLRRANRYAFMPKQGVELIPEEREFAADFIDRFTRHANTYRRQRTLSSIQR